MCEPGREAKAYIEAKQAEYRYPRGNFRLEPVTLSLRRGEITFLIGANGSGKSTLGKLLAGIVKPTAGTVLLGGDDTAKLNLGQIGQRLGYLWQNPQLQIFAETPLEDLTFAGGIKGEDPECTKKAAEEWLDFFCLTKQKEQSVYRLSGGERQRLALAGILMQDPGYLILDEPTKNLDEGNRRKLAGLLLDLQQEKGTGILVISHDEEFMEGTANRVISMEKGVAADDRCLE